MDKLKILLITKFILFLALLLFFIVFTRVPKSDCQACRFEINNENISIEKFIGLYYDKCVYPFKKPILNINFTINQSANQTL